MNSEIQQLKQLWQHAIKAHRQHYLLLATREDLMSKIISIQEEFKLNYFLPKENTLKEKQLDLKNLLIKKQEIDILLDDIEEITDKTIEEFKERLINEIIKTFPEKNTFYQELIAKIKRADFLEKLESRAEEVFHQLNESINRALVIRKSVKGKGILQYIFGKSPNIAISQCLHEGLQIVKAAIPFFDQYPFTNNEEAAAITELLSEIQIQCNKQWGFKHLDTVLTELFKKVKNMEDQFRLKRQATSHLKEQLDRELVEWLEKCAI